MKSYEPEHIDRKSLYTNLEARIDYLHRFLDFNENDIEALAFGSQFVQDIIPAVVHIVYQKLLQFDITARAFETRDTRSEEPLKNGIDVDSAIVQERKMFLNAYLKKMCSDQSQMEFWEYLDQVGAMHVGLHKQRPLRIEYIHINATLCVIQHVLTEAILSHNALPMSRRTAMVVAISKVIWIQNDLFAKWCVRDGEEFNAEGETTQPAPSMSHISPPKGTTSEGQQAGTCPFSGMTQAMQGLSTGPPAH
ncbi:unnamed protein product [Clonostachys rosea f. rosea IK726]|uniref:Globin-sensor domain-containing protein n=2 Tax=Bionectria ochroleuca TaxID=29856 RepID=A0A0B7JMQ0_BIOOC|nr:unnamed protein product [Clonostachys rosea f. rosea IK726]